MKVCVIGGGSTYTPELIEGFLKIEKQLDIKEIVMLDIKESERKINILTDFSKRIINRAGSKIKLSSTYDAKEAVTDADVVISQMRAGCLQGRVKDEKIPLDFGLIGQETTGMGGMANGLRALPIIEKYTDLIAKYSNDAWIINFTNPSGMLTEFIVNTLGYKKCIGLCNVPIEFIMRSSEIFKCKRDDIFLKYYGLNHLVWVEEVWVNDKNRTNELWDNFDVNMKNIPDVEYDKSFLPTVKLLLNGYLRYFYNTKEMLKTEIDERNSEGTRGEQIQVIEEELLNLYSESDRDTPPEELSKRGGFMYSTVATELVHDLFTDSGKVHIIDTPNNGTIENLPDDYLLEIPAKITKNGPIPIKIGNASLMTVGLIHTIKNYERLTIEGYHKRNEDLIKQAMMVHPLGPDEKDLINLWNKLKKANSGFFPKF
jgi:6-phospho-beta-glucosidase